MGSTQLRQINQFRNQLDIPAVFGGVIEASGQVSSDVAGVVRRGTDQAAKSTHRVHIGSCCKMLTAALFGTFVERGAATWQMPVAGLFPDLADATNPAWQGVPVHELCYCLSGMVANPPRHYLRSGYRDSRPLPEQRSELAALALSQAPRTPGRFVYSNMSYIVIGAAVDRLSGTSYEEALTARLLRPLGITSAGFGPPKEIWGHGARVVFGGMALGKGAPVDPADGRSDNPPLLSSAGTLHLTIDDWSALLRLFLREDERNVVQRATIDRILQMPPSNAGRMAMGWAPAQLEGNLVRRTGFQPALVRDGANG